MKAPLFSVVVPMYNVEKYARQCIESVLAQSFADFELILVDDGAKDSTPKIIDEYAEKDARIIVVRKENGGLVSARKAGAEIAKGKYIVPVDGDDWVHRDMLQKYADAIAENTDADVICSDCFYTTDSGEETPKQMHSTYGALNLEYLEKNVYTDFSSFPQSQWAKAYKRELYALYEAKIPDSVTIGEDEALIYPMLYDVNNIVAIPDKLYYYRYNPSSMTKSRKKEWSTDGLLARVKLFEESLDLEKFNLENQLTAYVAHATINQCLSYFKANPYGEAKRKARTLLNNELVRKYIDRSCRFGSKKEKMAKMALQIKIFPLIKLYSMFW